MDQITVRIRKVRSEAIVPKYMTELAAGMDLHACIDEPVTLGKGCRLLIPTGIAMAIPPGYEGQVRPRSGLALKQGVALVNSPGTIDADYRGEVGVILINLGDQDVTLLPGDRIAQLVITPVYRALLQLVEELEQTERDAGGFGHTGVSLER